MRHCRLVIAAFCLLCALPRAEGAAVRWWEHVKYLADDKLAGRDLGSEGHRLAAAYVAQQFERAGLNPGGTNGFFQPVTFRSRRIIEAQSRVVVVRDGRVVPLTLGEDAMINLRVAPSPRVEAPMTFVGYGLSVPEAKYDDFAGVDLRGRIAVFLVGAPPGISPVLLSHYMQMAERWQALKRAGAVGTITIQHPRALEIPWERAAPARLLPSVSLADSAMDDTAGQQLALTMNPARSEKLFEGSGHSFSELVRLADVGGPMPHFPLNSSLSAVVTIETGEIESPNVVGILPGMDAVLRLQYVVLSAHLDHMGTDETQKGDPIYNGAMDNASGVATLVETAAAAREQNKSFRRSLVFLADTGEEKGLLGSRHFAANPTVPSNAIVANVNTDMFLPLFPVRSLIVNGLEESDLAADARAAASSIGIAVVSDPEPERNGFTRSDHYSFVRRGIPALSFKVGFSRGSREHEIIRRWRSERYHGTSDDVSQPVDLNAAAEFNRAYLAIVETIANRPTRPRWNSDSFFRRFARTESAASSVK